MSTEELSGTVLGGFRLMEMIGSGGMAVVYRGENALDSSIQRAIKIVRAEFASREDFVRRFMLEARVLNELVHPNIVRFYGVRREGEHLLMELELLKGRTLDTLIRTERIAVERAIDIVRSAADGIGAAHAQGVAHRDIKPENIFISRDGSVKVLDFGIAKALDDADRASNATVAGHVPGTPAYMAPEVCSGAVPNPAADVYALGLTLYQAIAGVHPFQKPGQERTSTQLMFAHVTETIPSLAEIGASSAAVSSVVQKATRKNPADRYRDAVEFGEALRSLGVTIGGRLSASDLEGSSGTRFALPTFGASSSTTNGASLETISAKSRPRSKAGLILGGVAAAVALVGLGYMFGPVAPNAGSSGIQEASASSARPLAGDAPAPSLTPSSTGAPASGSAGALPFKGDNLWHLVQAPQAPVALGLPAGEVALPGFVSGKLESPSEAYLIMKREVARGEFETWLKAKPAEVQKDYASPPDANCEEASPLECPATNVPWRLAREYCHGVGGELPTEAQWEYAARGSSRRKYPWGGAPVDQELTPSFRGPGAKLRKPGSSPQDKTPSADGKVLDLMGNAGEWTLDEYVDGATLARLDGADAGQFRTVRGLRLEAPELKNGQNVAELARNSGAAYRRPLCVTNECLTEVPTLLHYVGFRCVRTPE